MGFELTTLVVTSTDCTGSYKSHYQTTTTTLEFYFISFCNYIYIYIYISKKNLYQTPSYCCQTSVFDTEITVPFYVHVCQVKRLSYTIRLIMVLFEPYSSPEHIIYYCISLINSLKSQWSYSYRSISISH